MSQGTSGNEFPREVLEVRRFSQFLRERDGLHWNVQGLQALQGLQEPNLLADERGAAYGRRAESTGGSK